MKQHSLVILLLMLLLCLGIASCVEEKPGKNDITTDSPAVTETDTVPVTETVAETATETETDAVSETESPPDTEPVSEETTVPELPVTETVTPIETEPITEPTPSTENVVVTDIPAYIDKQLAILLADTENKFNEAEFIEAEPEAFDAIVALGADAVPYLSEIAKTTPTGYFWYNAPERYPEFYRGILAHMAINTIDPTHYRREFVSPDGRYAVRADAVTFATLTDPFMGYTYRLSMLDKQNDTVCAEGGTTSTLTDTYIWSPDGNYAAFAETYRYYGYYIRVFDAKSGIMHELPDFDAISSRFDAVTFDEPVFPLLSAYPRFLTVDSFGEDTIRISITVGSEPRGEDVTLGYYDYDFKTQEITNFVITEPHTVKGDQATFDEASRQTVDAALSKIVENNAEYENRPVKDFLDAFPDEISAIAALGSPAAWYLRGVANDDAKDSICRVFARYLSCMIDSDLFMEECPSPDGVYSIVCHMDTAYLSTHDYIADGNAYMSVSLIRNSTGEVYTENESIMYKVLRVEWSPDGRYVSLFADAGSYNQTACHFYDTETLARIPLPTDAEFASVLGARMPADLEEFFVGNIVPGEWLAEDCVRLQVFNDDLWSTDLSKHYYLDGTYVYDLRTKKITALDCEIREIQPPKEG